MGMENIEFENENADLKQIKVNLGDSVETVAQKLFACKEKGIKAFAILNGIPLNNYEFDNIREVVSSYSDSLNNRTNTPSSKSNPSSHTNTSESGGSKIDSSEIVDGKNQSNNSSFSSSQPNDKTTVQYVEVKENESIESVAKKLEVCSEQGIKAVAIVDDVLVDNITTNNASEIVKNYNKQVDIDKELKNANIILEKAFHYESRFGLNAKEIRVGRYDRIQEVIEKLKFCKDHGINAFINFNGVILNNYDNFHFNFNDPYKIMNWYNREQQKLNNEKTAVNDNATNVTNNGDGGDTTYVSPSYSYGTSDYGKDLNSNGVLPTRLDIGGRPYSIGGPVNELNLNKRPSSLPSNGGISQNPDVGLNTNNLNDSPDFRARANNMTNSVGNIPQNSDNNNNFKKNRNPFVDANPVVGGISDIEVPDESVTVSVNEDFVLSSKEKVGLAMGKKGAKENKLLYNPNNRMMRHINNYMMAMNPVPDEEDEEADNVPLDDEVDQEEDIAPEMENKEENGATSNSTPDSNGNDEGEVNGSAENGKKSNYLQKILKFILKHPWVLGIIGTFAIVILILIIISGESNNEGEGYYDKKCNYNETAVVLAKCNEGSAINLSLEEYILGVANYYSKQNLSNEALKAIMIIAKTNALSEGGYNSSSKSVSINDCVIGYDDTGGSTSWNSLYSEIENYLYLSSSYQDNISSLGLGNSLEFNENIVAEIDAASKSGNTYSSILDSIYNSNTGNTEPNVEYRSNLFIGDSRMHGMALAGLVSSNNAVYGTGYGYNWLIGSGSFSADKTNATAGAINGINAKMEAGKKYNIITWLGINDYSSNNAQTYFDKYYELATGDWKDHIIYIVSVGPVDDAKAAYVNNQGINAFNAEMLNLVQSSSATNIKFINVNYAIESYDSEGLHYGANDYNNIYNQIESNVENGLSSVYKLYNLSDYCSFYTITENESYWWPIGSRTATEGNIYGGPPSATKITSTFGYRTIEGSSGNHGAIDIGASCNTDVVIASKKGKIIAVNNTCDNNGSYGNKCGRTYGNYVDIEHEDGVVTRYGHMYPGSIVVSEGDEVQQGQKIGMVGNSGSSTGCHLHFEVRVNNVRVDPLDYVDQTNYRPVSAHTYNGVQDGSTGQEYVCKSLLNSGFSENAVAGMLVNIRAEGSFKTNNLENCYEEGHCCSTRSGKNYGYCIYKNYLSGFASDEKYTAGIDNGSYPRDSFISDHAGYGLIQWTSSGRKGKLYDYAKSQNKSIADMDVQLGYLLQEVEGYSVTYKYLTGNYSANEIATNFCLDFERPANKESSCPNRANAYTEEMLSYVKNGCQ